MTREPLPTPSWMLGGVRSFSPFSSLSTLSLSLAPFHLFLSLCLFFALFSSRFPATFGGEGGGRSVSFFLSPPGPAPSFSTILARFLLGTLLSPPFRRRSPRGFPLSSLLMPRDRQMMIKKAPVRVRTTPRRPVPPPASLLVLHHLLLLLPLLYLRQFFFLFSSLDSLRCTSPPSSPTVADSLFFFPSLDFRSFVPSFLVCPPPPSSPETFFFFRGPSFPCGYTFVACIMVRGECFRTACPICCRRFRKDVTGATFIEQLWPIDDGEHELSAENDIEIDIEMWRNLRVSPKITCSQASLCSDRFSLILFLKSI